MRFPGRSSVGRFQSPGLASHLCGAPQPPADTSQATGCALDQTPLRVPEGAPSRGPASACGHLATPSQAKASPLLRCNRSLHMVMPARRAACVATDLGSRSPAVRIPPSPLVTNSFRIHYPADASHRGARCGDSTSQPRPAARACTISSPRPASAAVAAVPAGDCWSRLSPRRSHARCGAGRLTRPRRCPKTEGEAAHGGHNPSPVLLRKTP